MVLRSVVAIALATTTLAGCGASQVQRDFIGAHTLVEYSAAADHRDLRTVIVGNPFGGSDAEFDRAVTGLLNSTGYGVVQTNFTTTPSDTARPEYKLVMVFNPPLGLASIDVCEDRPFQTDPAARPILVRAAWCIEGRPTTSATGRLRDAASPADPNFVSMIRDLNFALFPA